MEGDGRLQDRSAAGIYLYPSTCLFFPLLLGLFHHSFLLPLLPPSFPPTPASPPSLLSSPGDSGGCITPLISLQGSLDEILSLLKARDRQPITFRTEISNSNVSPSAGAAGEGAEGGQASGHAVKTRRRHSSKPKTISTELLSILPSIDYSLSRTRSNSKSRDEDPDMAKLRERLRRQSLKTSSTARLSGEEMKSQLRGFSSMSSFANV